MKHRWMDVVKRSKDALTSSPKSDKSRSPAQQQQQHTTTTPSSSSSSSSARSHPHRQSFAPPPPLHIGSVVPSASARTLIPRSQSMIDVIGASMRGNDSEFASEAENPAFFHFEERCKGVSGECTVTKVLENCVLQGGVHHTYMNVLTYMGTPLRADTCCYSMSVQWFRAFGGHDDFQVIPGACDEFFTATADDIGARILAKVMLEDEDVVKTKMLEYGPIKEDPEVRSKVEMYLERKSVLFMGLQSILVRDGDEYPNDVELRESWTLLIDDRRVRLTCESSLIPPFEALYTSDIKVEVVRSAPNEFCLYLADSCFVHLRAESNVVRDIIVLTVRAFCTGAMSSEMVTHAVAKGMSPMLTIRSLADERAPAEEFVPAPAYNLPWNRHEPDSDGSDACSSSGNEPSPVDARRRSSSPVGAGHAAAAADGSGLSVGGDPNGGDLNGGSALSPPSDDELDDSLLLDADALIGNALKMGIKNQVLPRAPKRISIQDIADLQIVEVGEPGAADGGASAGSDGDGGGSSEAAAAVAWADGTGGLDAGELEALKAQYTAVFCALQRELSESKRRVAELTQRLDDKSEENAAFRSDIETLQTALTAVQVADKANELVVADLKQLAKARKTAPVAAGAGTAGTGASTRKAPPQNFY